MSLSYVLKSPQEMELVVANLLQNLKQPCIFLLEGEPGSGKTTFVKYFCKHLGVPETVNSPSFNLMNRYQSKVNVDPKNKCHERTDTAIYHLDLYRLKTDSDYQIESLIDIQESEYICCVEWPRILNTNWNKWASYHGAQLHEILFEYTDHQNQRKLSFL